MNSLPQESGFVAKTALAIKAQNWALLLICVRNSTDALRRHGKWVIQTLHCGSEFIREGTVQPSHLYRLQNLSRMNSLPQESGFAAKTAFAIKAQKWILLLICVRDSSDALRRMGGQ